MELSSIRMNKDRLPKIVRDNIPVGRRSPERGGGGGGGREGEEEEEREEEDEEDDDYYFLPHSIRNRILVIPFPPVLPLAM